MERRGSGDNLGFEQFMPDIEHNQLSESAAEVVEKLPEEKMEESKRKMDETGMMAMTAAGKFGRMAGHWVQRMG